ncbi:fibrinogen-like YCDxxxxGGGW domain-containing protein [Nannocystis sp.]|uniref:fibrinogen-like YCDxxxxGGGW domain-containing protein n=1 Tax=Nannocystis sp. TaxID=1962667 RepID=UPI0024265060|nr:fibrinogen-like YCDxxxxGGGW domain-containing protein [Nannocystis sp.]MBK9753317.1 hypothetical protein [Nannocystis sp.]
MLRASVVAQLLWLAACARNPAFDLGGADGPATTSSASGALETSGEAASGEGVTSSEGASGDGVTGGVATSTGTSGISGCDGCEGTCIAGSCVPVAASCLAYRDEHGVQVSGVYPIDPDGAGPGAPFMVHCEMVADGGGWTLVVKVDGRAKTFQYALPDVELDHWDDPDSFGEPAYDHTEAKLPSYASVPLSELRVGLEYPVVEAGAPQPNTLVMPAQGPSLHALMAADQALEVAPSTGSWQALVPDALLQVGCLRQGLNIRMKVDDYGSARVRIGVIADNQGDQVCIDPDSYIGVGARVHCNSFSGSAGGESCWVGPQMDSGLAARLAFGYVWVR